MFELSASDAGDIAITAAEGGIGYWAVAESYKPSRWYAGDGTHPDNVPDDFAFYTLYDSTHPLGQVVTVAVIRRGWNRLIERWEKRSLNPYGFDPRDMGSIDSNVADLIVQLGLFDEVVYG